MTAWRTNQILCQEKWKKLRFWKNEAQNRVGIFWQNPIFLGWNFFQRPLENFVWTLRTCSRYLRGPPNLVLCVSKKNRDRTTHKSDYMLGKVKKFEILKKWSSKSGQNILTNVNFFRILKLHRELKNFLGMIYLSCKLIIVHILFSEILKWEGGEKPWVPSCHQRQIQRKKNWVDLDLLGTVEFQIYDFILQLFLRLALRPPIGNFKSLYSEFLIDLKFNYSK